MSSQTGHPAKVNVIPLSRRQSKSVLSWRPTRAAPRQECAPRPNPRCGPRIHLVRAGKYCGIAVRGGQQHDHHVAALAAQFPSATHIRPSAWTEPSRRTSSSARSYAPSEPDSRSSSPGRCAGAAKRLRAGGWTTRIRRAGPLGASWPAGPRGNAGADVPGAVGGGHETGLVFRGQPASDEFAQLGPGLVSGFGAGQVETGVHAAHEGVGVTLELLAAGRLHAEVPADRIERPLREAVACRGRVHRPAQET
ncbi:hypothetical protein A4R44_06519 [Amycolatopsis sp. M39]|nr:hypothetical protein A4R44_06519 [Amycolatopsis sp. M39]